VTLPSVSIVIPTRGRPRPLSACLDALAAIDYPRDRVEIVVVDDGGGGLEHVVAPFRDRLQVVLLEQAQAGPARARNAGAARARGDVLAFTDDDCAPAPDWLRRITARLQSNPDRLIGGRTVNGLPGSACSTASQLLVSYVYGYYNEDPDDAGFVASNNIGVARAAFLAAGGFDETFAGAAEDRDFCSRWQDGGRRIVYAPEAVVEHRHVLDLRSFWRQHFGYGVGAHRFHHARARRRGIGLRLERPAFYLDLARYPFGQEPATRAAVLSALLFVAQAANAAGFFSARWRGGS
jgi:GT2 family glycosyltransferase